MILPKISLLLIPPHNWEIKFFFNQSLNILLDTMIDDSLIIIPVIIPILKVHKIIFVFFIIDKIIVLSLLEIFLAYIKETLKQQKQLLPILKITFLIHKNRIEVGGIHLILQFIHSFCAIGFHGIIADSSLCKGSF